MPKFSKLLNVKIKINVWPIIFNSLKVTDVDFFSQGFEVVSAMLQPVTEPVEVTKIQVKGTLVLVNDAVKMK
ncbi:hypothetical protein [Pseudoalteromonas sp. T1lg23B]|uniref:hypothetical protein n=1 Tax=Pseudoalteromonas sp. T1lg23B TaxID=2077097 RepID=UPI000CF68A43|nr:hypothetical protein [Pseudoalteromonas sp. T1lg23B]